MVETCEGGHSGHKWNDRADELADEGVRETVLGRIESGDWNDQADAAGLCAGQGEATAEPRRPRAHGCRGVRWVTYQPTETLRVLRSRTHFGALNLPTPRAPVPAQRIRQAGAECLKLLSEEGRMAATGGDAQGRGRARACTSRRPS